jgi:tRNA A-37 threonylcarbamoyl transferase component Bud32
MTMTPVERIGRYAVEGVIGTGAFATVYRARDERLDAVVAVKVLADNHCLDPDMRARFIDEGRALRRVDSPHVVRVYDVGETDKLQPFMVLEHADRGTLASRVAGLRAGGWRPGADDVRSLVTGLAAALEAIHTARLVHRDLTPGNVLLTSDAAVRVDGDGPGTGASGLIGAGERLVVSDLGLAKDLARSSGLTVTGGTDGFRPPEQRGQPTTIDARADLWAATAVVFWLLTGAAPYAGNAADKRKVAAGLADLGLPDKLRAPLLRGLSDDPARRQADVATWRAEIDAALQAERAPAEEPPPRGSSGRKVVVAATALLVVVALVGVVGALMIDRSDDGVTTTPLAEGQVRVTDHAGSARLSLSGPTEARVGATVTLTAAAHGVDHWAWLMPDGAVYADRPTVQLRTRSAGVAQVTVVATTASGERLEATHQLRLTGR